MENSKKLPQDTTKVNAHKGMPIKTPDTDEKLNTADETDGLNQARNAENSLEPGTTAADPDFTETD